MEKSLPKPISTYFEAKNGPDAGEVLNCFSPTAVVVDTGENMEMRGQEAIRKWLTGTVASYNLTTEVLRFIEKDGETIVTALVSGDFPGSPIEFDYGFVLADDKIERLVIR